MTHENTRNSAIHHLRRSMTSVIGPDDPGFDDARITYYHGLDRRPDVIARPANATEVSTVVQAAIDTGLPLAVRSGGHSVAGHSSLEGGIVLDLSGLKSIDIDPAGRTAWAGTGLTAAEYTAAAGEHGMATPFGDTGSVGIGGITLGGGVGLLHRNYGLTVDNLLAAEIVTADGQVINADPKSDPDLFWAIRGGGGNFGVATRFRYRLHQTGTVVGGPLAFIATSDSLASLLEIAQTAPDEVSGMINVMVVPPIPFIDEEHHGTIAIAAMLVHSGDADRGSAFFDRLRSIATPIMDMARPMAYHEVFQGPEPPHPAFAATENLFADDVDRGPLDAVLAAVQSGTAPMRVVQFRVLGGAVARVPTDATAFAHRSRKMLVVVGAAYEHPDDAEEQARWAGSTADVLRTGDDGAYVNFLGDVPAEAVRAAYPAATWDRLRAVKAKYDPTNLFRSNHNIPPA